MSKKTNISDCSECYSEDILIKYVNDELNSEESAAVEAHILQCEMCSDVVDGLFMLEAPENLTEVTNKLNLEIDSLIRPIEKKKILNISTYRAIAAIALLLVLSGTYILINNKFSDKDAAPMQIVKDIPPAENEEKIKSSEDIEQIADVKTGDERKVETKNSVFIPEIINTNSDYKISNQIDLLEEISMSTPESVSKETIVVDIVTEKSDRQIDVSGATGNTYTTVLGGIDDSEHSQYPSGSGETTKSSTNTQEMVSQKTNKSESSIDGKKADEILAEKNSKNLRDKGKFEKDAPANPIEDKNEVIAEGIVLSDDVYMDAAVSSEVLSIAYDTDEEVYEEECIAFAVVEEKPQFPGGDSAIISFLSSNIIYPPEAKDAGIQGKVYAQFVIDKTGKVTKVTIVKGVDPYLDLEVLRVIRLMPDWKPGKQRGLSVPVTYVIPVNFRAE